MIVDQLLAELDYVLRFIVEQTDRFNVVAHRRFTQDQHLLRRISNLE